MLFCYNYFLEQNIYSENRIFTQNYSFPTVFPLILFRYRSTLVRFYVLKIHLIMLTIPILGTMVNRILTLWRRMIFVTMSIQTFVYKQLEVAKEHFLCFTHIAIHTIIHYSVLPVTNGSKIRIRALFPVHRIICQWLISSFHHLSVFLQERRLYGRSDKTCIILTYYC